MRTVFLIKIGIVAALWTVIAGAAVSGWMLGKRDAAREYSDLQRRLTSGTETTRSCGMDVELLDLKTRGKETAETGPVEISAAPRLYHLREMLTLR